MCLKLSQFGEMGGSKRSLQEGGHPRTQTPNRVEVHLLVDNVLSFGCGGGPSLPVLHQVNSDKKANSPEGGEERKLDTLD